MQLENTRLLVEIADNTGNLMRIRDKQRQTDYAVCAQEPFRVTRANAHDRLTLTKATACRVQAEENGASVCWQLEDGSRLHGRITLLEDGAAFTSRLEAAQDSEVVLVEYPVIGGMGKWAEHMEMVHAFATGLLVHDPLDCFAPGEGIRYAPYPECFSGASMQCFAYYGKGAGGLRFTAEDGESHAKWLNLYRNGDGMEATMMYIAEDMGKGKSFAAEYPFTVRLMEGRSWFEVAEGYKAWANEQSWCSMGKVAERRHCEWLMRSTGLTTFGITASHDRTAYIRRYHQDIGSSIFHILGPDWTKQDFVGHVPGALEEWLPGNFNQQNLAAIQECGDHFAPFEFDYLVHPGEKDADALEKARQVFPPQGQTYSCDAYNFYMMCPCEEYTHKLHVERDRCLTENHHPDGMYYDISANNLLHVCLSDKHKHTKGGGTQVTKAYQRLYQETKDACGKAEGRYFPIGTEMMNEVFLPQLDFYQARAGAQPASALEMWPYKKQLNAGQAELIPLFAAVYHEYGAVRMDGWGKLVEEIGDLFYDTVAKTYLWGGLYEINDEYSPMEAMDGVETRSDEHYWPFESYGYEYAPGRARYLRQFAALRTGAGNPYLSYGRMLEEPPMPPFYEKKRYWHYNHGAQSRFSGEIELPVVRAAAWESGLKEHPGRAILLVNTSLSEVKVPVHLPGDYDAEILTDFDPEHEPERRRLEQQQDLELTLPPRKIVMIEMTPQGL